MNGIDLSRNATGLLTRINQITGWRLPENEQLIKVLEAEFTEYLSTNVADMNSKEIISAIRTHGLGIIEWGKSMNLFFIDECVILYKSQRAELSKIEEWSSIEQKRAKIESEYHESVDWTNEWNNILYAAKIGQISNCWITTDLYEWLIREKVMDEPTKEDKWEVIRMCAKNYIAEINDALLNGGSTEPPYEIKRRIALLSNLEAPIWKKDTAIMSTLQTMAKKEMVRQLAIIHAANESE